MINFQIYPTACQRMKLTGNKSHGFGHLGMHIKNQITYTMSSFEQNALKGTVSNGIPNTLRRIRSKFFVIALPVFTYYQIYCWGIREQLKLDRKNPKDFANDE